MKMTIQSIPNTLDVNELMGVKGGFLGINICIDNHDYPDPRCVFAPPIKSPLRY